MLNPADRSIASVQARFGTHQFVQSCEYSRSTKCSFGNPVSKKMLSSENS